MQIITVILSFLFLPIHHQVVEIEKQALAIVQQMPVSSLDPELPEFSFATWFKQVVGPNAGVVWQLTECGELNERKIRGDGDLTACTEVNALLPDGRKVMIAISVGTFKKGLSGSPVFYNAIIEHENQLYQVRRLRDLHIHLQAPGIAPIQLAEVAVNSPHRLSEVIDLPKITIKHPLVIQYFEPADSSLPKIAPYPYPESAVIPENQPSVPGLSQENKEPLKPQKVSEALLRGRAIFKLNPTYPANAETVPVFFRSVAVVIVVSEDGRVIQAKAISGHPTLRGPAVEAARKWVFEPSKLNGQPVTVESILTFVFSAGSQ
jgi:hypothetical protein